MNALPNDGQDMQQDDGTDSGADPVMEKITALESAVADLKQTYTGAGEQPAIEPADKFGKAGMANALFGEGA